ncbi:MAG: cache domain-containing protein, partial [Anaerolineales bacterium]
MLQERFRRWRRNAGFWLLVLIMLIVLLVAVYTYKGYRNAATELVLERDEQLVVLSAARLREELGNLSENLEVLARSRDLSSGDPARQREAIEEAAPRLAIFDGGVLLLDEKGLVLLSYPERGDLNGEDLSDQALFQGVFDENLLFVSDVQRMGMDGQQVVMIGVPIQGDEGQFSGALVGMFELGADSLSAFYASIVRLRLGQSGTTYIADSSGRILYDSGSGRIGRSLTVEQLSILDEDGGPEALLTVDEHGNQIVAAFAPVPGTPWELIIEDDWAILTQSTRRFSNVLLLSFGVAMVLPPLSLAILSRQRRFRILADSLPQREEHIVRVLRRELHPQQ